MKPSQLLALLTFTFLFNSPLSTAQDGNPNKPSQIPEFPIYVDANTASKLVEKADLNTPLIKIIQQKDWIKVANRSNGAVGWIQEGDYKNALKAAYQAKNQTLFINIQEKSGTPTTMDVIAYKNGKKLDEKETKALYDQLKKEQEARDRAMGQWLRSMNDFFNRMHSEALIMPNLVDHFQPVVLIEKPTQEVDKPEKPLASQKSQKPNQPQKP